MCASQLNPLLDGLEVIDRYATAAVRAGLVSACLLGLPTRYDGTSKRSRAVIDYLQRENLLPVPICPEQLAGLATPREKTFFKSGCGLDVLAGTGEVVSETGLAMNEVFCRGAKMSLQIGRVRNGGAAGAWPPGQALDRRLQCLLQ